MGDWSLKSVQFSWFTSRFAELSASQLYTRLVGDEPDNFQKGNASAGALRFHSLAAGVKDNHYQVMITPGRVDFICTAASEASPDERFVGLDPEQTLRATLKHVVDAGAVATTANRLTVVTTLRCAASSEEEASRGAFSIAGVADTIDGSTDFAFQLNKRLTLPNTGVTINRVVKYATETVQSMVFQMGPDANSIPAGAPEYFATVQFDFNTVPMGVEYNESLQLELFHEIVELQAGAMRDFKIDVVLA
jgi:hypothetical protein